MRNQTKLTIACGLIAVTSAIGFAQDTHAAPKYYRLDFAVQELDGGKVTNSRHYVTTIATVFMPGQSLIRTGSKVPIMSSGTGTNSEQYTYIDLGVNIDCREAKEMQGELALNVAAEISTAATSSRQPVIRQIKWQSNVVVTLGKPTVIFSSDDLTTKYQLQLELTAKPIEAH